MPNIAFGTPRFVPMTLSSASRDVTGGQPQLGCEMLRSCSNVKFQLQIYQQAGQKQFMTTDVMRLPDRAAEVQPNRSNLPRTRDYDNRTST